MVCDPVANVQQSDMQCGPWCLQDGAHALHSLGRACAQMAGGTCAKTEEEK